MRTDIPGLILAGGLARRMGGGDKPLLSLGDRPILGHVITRLRPQVGPILLNANGDPARFARYGLPVLPDSLPDYPGPLAGVLAGLDWAADHGFEAIITVAADTPFFPADLIARLFQAAEITGKSIALAATPDPQSGQIRHPTFGFWPIALRNDLRNALQDGLRKIVLWTDRHGAASAEFPIAPHDPFFNVNTPEDLRRAENIFRTAHTQSVFGIVGWKNSGKTGLMERLVADITGRGLTVSTVKHAHHTFEVDHPGKDSYRHRDAGACEVLLASRKRWALMHELREQGEPPLADLLTKLALVDLVLIEGYKSDRHPKIEVHRAATGQLLIAPDDPTVLAVASDSAHPDLDLQVLDLNATVQISNFILQTTGLHAPQETGT